tara:strand:- start:5303 stop:5914 length:612 start_codon:yes stop_codon:yes gene_type:complete
MSLNFVEQRNITGHLQISKRPRSGGPEEILFDDHNIIVSGMGVGLSILYSLSGSDSITDFQLDRFQVGLSAAGLTETSAVYQLSGPLPTVQEYAGVAGGLLAVSSTQLANGVDKSDQAFGMIPFSHITRINNTSVRYTIILDEDSANDIQRDDSYVPLNEIGLFMKNPQGRPNDASLLVAYRQFSSITKASDFALVFRWTINF